MRAVFKHTGITARNWKLLANFYIEVFECVIKPPERHMSGEWLAQGTGVPDARIDGVHLLLPGSSGNGPTLVIFSYEKNVQKPESVPHREGFTHLAFEVDDVTEALGRVLRHGGSMFGEVVTHEVEGAGMLTFVYAKDPEGNIIELQSWD